MKRKHVEAAAVELVRLRYERLGFEVTSVERDRYGRGLTARRGRSELRLEVEGHSQDRVVSELTPNEYQALRRDAGNRYRLCVVVNAFSRIADVHELVLERPGAMRDFDPDEVWSIEALTTVFARVTRGQP